ncbi:MAG: hypothetical protein CL912_12875 [Deltaproteobacteria bacterium]|nr:hypothetical protein [Deltaproteobacteria bacterium]
MLYSFLSAAALLAPALAVVQPLNTTILGQYGHSPAVYPSRMFSESRLTNPANSSKQMPQALVDGKKLLRRRKSSLLS